MGPSFAARWTPLLLPLLLAGCGAGVLPAVHSDSERLALARRLHDRGDCSEAIELLKSYVATQSGSAQVDEALYLLGDCYLKTKDWMAAVAEFERLVRDYPESDSSGAAGFKLGEAHFGQSRPQDFDQEYSLKALEQWRTYLRSFPGHWLNAEAERRILQVRTRLANKMVDNGRLYLKLKLPNPARVYFRLVMEQYADTPAAGPAALGLAICDAQQGRRAEAIAQLREVESRFTGQPVAERAARERSRLERR